MKTTVQKIIFPGNGLGYFNGKVVILPWTLPGEEIEFTVFKEYKDYMLGRIQSIIKPSGLRKDADCKYYSVCGGCSLMHTHYMNQIEIKKELFSEQFKRQGLNININPIFIKSDPDFYYRNKIKLHYDKNNLCHYYSLSTNKPVRIKECIIAGKNINFAIQNLNNITDISYDIVVIREDINKNIFLSFFSENKNQGKGLSLFVSMRGLQPLGSDPDLLAHSAALRGPSPKDLGLSRIPAIHKHLF